MRVFLDANILFSGAQEDSPIREMLDTLSKHAALVTSPYAVTEAERNIAVKRDSWMAGLQTILGKVARECGQSDCGDVQLDQADRPILAATVAAKCTHLLTGDFRHFGHLMGQTVHGVAVISARILAEEILRRGWVRKGTHTPPAPPPR